MEETIRLLLGAVRSAMWGRALPAASAPEIWKDVYTLAQTNDLAFLVYEGAVRGNATLPEEVSKRFLRSAGAAFGRFCAQNHAMERLSDAFEQAQIDYLPLKGLVLRDLYPTAEWRVGRDLDILIRPADLNRACAALRQALAPVTEKKATHDVAFETPDGVRLELHFSLFDDVDRCGTLLSHPFAHAFPCVSGGHRYRLPDAELYAYQIAHMAKHLRYGGGCGIRPFLDLFLLSEQIGQAAREKGETLLSVCDLEGFARVVHHASTVFFGDGDEDAKTDALLRFILKNQAFGTYQSAAALQKSDADTATDDRSHLLSRLFPSYRYMCRSYPVLRRAPVLLPFCWGVRGLHIFAGPSRTRFLEENRAYRTVGQEHIDEMSRMLDYLQL
ncbi:MAG: nucleotidyltransferase family protein [Clostridia bacterium]|nr:nucleotidyltransferase family protein [Clostridia bacterium]